jgi:hypothetical protein
MKIINPNAWHSEAVGYSFYSMKNKHAVALGKIGGRVSTPAKVKAARRNGKLGGRPAIKTISGQKWPGITDWESFFDRQQIQGSKIDNSGSLLLSDLRWHYFGNNRKTKTMITKEKTTRYKTSDGKCFDTDSEAKAHELEPMFVQLSNSCTPAEIAVCVVTNTQSVLDVLITDGRKRRRVKKPAKKAKSTEQVAQWTFVQTITRRFVLRAKNVPCVKI